MQKEKTRWATKDSKVARMTSEPRLCASNKSSLAKKIPASLGGHAENQLTVEVCKDGMAQARSTCCPRNLLLTKLSTTLRVRPCAEADLFQSGCLAFHSLKLVAV